MKKVISLALAAVICSASMLLAACGGNAGTATKDETPANTKTIATVDDLEGAKIGVQLGTTESIANNFIGDDTKGKTPYVTPEGTEYPNGELHMATNAFFEPYEYYDGDTVVGIDASMAQAICDKLGYKLVIDDMDFDAIVTAVQTGKADFGMAGMTVTEERQQAVSFSDSYTTATQVIIVKE